MRSREQRPQRSTPVAEIFAPVLIKPARCSSPAGGSLYFFFISISIALRFESPRH
jgi:hypothetical protein